MSNKEVYDNVLECFAEQIEKMPNPDAQSIQRPDGKGTISPRQLVAELRSKTELGKAVFTDWTEKAIRRFEEEGLPMPPSVGTDTH